jgi:hypothetical protein
MEQQVARIRTAAEAMRDTLSADAANGHFAAF